MENRDPFSFLFLGLGYIAVGDKSVLVENCFQKRTKQVDIDLYTILK